MIKQPNAHVTISVTLSDKQAERITECAQLVGCSTSQLIERIIRVELGEPAQGEVEARVNWDDNGNPKQN